MDAGVPGILFQRVQGEQSLVDGALLLQMVSVGLEKLAGADDQSSLGFIDARGDALFVSLRDGGDVERPPGGRSRQIGVAGRVMHDFEEHMAPVGKKLAYGSHIEPRSRIW